MGQKFGGGFISGFYVGGLEFLPILSLTVSMRFTMKRLKTLTPKMPPLRGL